MTVTKFTTSLTKNIFIDPTFLFNFGCVVSMFVLTHFQKPDEPILPGILNPWFLFLVSFYLVCELFPSVLSIIFGSCLPSIGSRNSNKNGNKTQELNIKLSYKQSMIARWYLQNAIVTHCMMDGTSAIFNLFPVMHEQYLKIDTRFHEPLSHEGTVATMTVETELFIMFPLALLTYYGMRCYAMGTYSVSNGNNSSNNEVLVRYPVWVYMLEIAVSTLHITGTIFYDGSEWVHILFNTGLTGTPIDTNFEFTLDHLMYFWFAFVLAPVIWIVVPLWMMKRAINELSILMGEQQHAKIVAKKIQ